MSEHVTRRIFLHASTAVPIAAALPSRLFAQTVPPLALSGDPQVRQSQQRPGEDSTMGMRFGLIGTGYWAEHCHGAGLAAHPDIEFVGVWGRDFAKASKVADRFGVVAEHDLDALLAKVDAVAIAVPPDVQPELACRAAAAGCHLLLEKPLALSVNAAEQVVAATQRSGVSSVVLFTLCFQEPTAQWLTDTVLGPKWHGGGITLLAPPLAPDGPFASSPWRQKYGAFWDLGPHQLSVMLLALGPVEKISGQRNEKGTTHLMLTHKGGGLSSVTFDLNMPQGTFLYEISFWNSAGRVTHLPYLPSRPSSPPPEFMKTAVSALLASVASGKPHACDVRFAAEITRLLAVCEC
jgi:hypothetical protein